MKNSTFVGRVREIVSDVFGVSLSDISLGTLFVEDLGSDETSMAELQTVIEDEFEKDFSDEVWSRIKTVGELVSLLTIGDFK